jgi:prolyl-tRNA editing enzyme YbaK/EbsC (Cys-tRNA(Pro) deacylase)
MLIRELTHSDYLIDHFKDCYNLNGLGCVESVEARGVSMGRELKHLMLKSQSGNFLVHIPASKMLSFDKVKSLLNDTKIEMGNIKDLGVRKGEVTPFVEPFWSMYHLIDDSVFNLDWMTTNDSTRTGYIKFNPKVLLAANQSQIAEIRA